MHDTPVSQTPRQREREQRLLEHIEREMPVLKEEPLEAEKRGTLGRIVRLLKAREGGQLEFQKQLDEMRRPERGAAARRAQLP